jgi:short-chain fatty acids transporter
MLERIGGLLSRTASRVVPDPFVLALGLTLVVMLLAALRLETLALPPAEVAARILRGWADGFVSPGGLAFALQMCLVLVTGHALALCPPVQRLIGLIARIPRGTRSASALVALVACLAGLVHWGLAAVAGALLARELARSAAARGGLLHYPILGAAAYSGLLVWHGGLSGSAPLKAAERGHFAESISGVVPLSTTLFGQLNLVVMALLLVLLPALFWAMTPGGTGTALPPPREEESRPGRATGLQDAPLAGRAVGGLGVVLVVGALVAGRLPLDLNAVILFFLFLGIALQGRLSAYVETVAEGARGAGGIILQFPFYFAVLGVMRAGGLIEWMSEALISISSPTSFPVLAFYSAGLVNLFVPSGGGQWAVQAEVLLGAGRALGVPASTTVVAFAWGDAWTNALQPFWALPLLGIMGLEARQIVGYTAVAFVLVGSVVTVALLAFG